MIRRIIQIDEEKCNGCGLCAQACHEGAIGMVNGKEMCIRDSVRDRFPKRDAHGADRAELCVRSRGAALRR